jgi:hypothetical protein
LASPRENPFLAEGGGLLDIAVELQIAQGPLVS